MYDAIHLSDIHLGSNVCMVDSLERFLAELPPTRRLVLGGDVLQSTDNRLARQHWRILSAFRKLSDDLELVWVAGNHDHDAEAVAHLVGANWCRHEYRYRSGEHDVVVVHGDAFDDFIRRRPFVTWMADQVHLAVQWLSPHLAVHLKRSSNTYRRCADKVKKLSLTYCREARATVVVCGHTHHREECRGEWSYFNTGCWTEPVCGYLVVKEGQFDLRTHEIRP